MDYVAIIMTVLTIVFGFLCTYLRTKTEITSKVAELITQAEETYQNFTGCGTVKFTLVVDTLYSYIPKALRFIITKDMLGVIVQNTFDSIEAYAKTQLDKLVDKVTK